MVNSIFSRHIIVRKRSMTFTPLLFNGRGYTIARTFIANAVVLAILAAAAIEQRRQMDKFFLTRKLSDPAKFGISILCTFITGLTIYFTVRLLWGFGEGMLASPHAYPTFL